MNFWRMFIKEKAIKTSNLEDEIYKEELEKERVKYKVKKLEDAKVRARKDAKAESAGGSGNSDPLYWKNWMGGGGSSSKKSKEKKAKNTDPMFMGNWGAGGGKKGGGGPPTFWGR